MKDEIFNYFKVFKAKAKNQTKKNGKNIWSDKGGEYTSSELVMNMV